MGKTSISEILSTYHHLQLENANEAATRLKVIDRVLKEVLMWTDSDIKPEEHVTEDGLTTYADYILKTANIALVVEAKKAGPSFTVTPGKRKVKLSNGFLQCDLGEAIIQARDYARKFGIDYAVATNGNVWACFPAQRHDNVKFNDSIALVFWSLEDCLHENYQEFYDLLSRENVISGSLETALLGRVENQIEFRKLRNFYSQQNRTQTNNPIYHLIADELRLAFSDSILYLDEDSFEKCYVSTPETMRFDSKIRMNIGRRSNVLNGEVLKGLNDKDTQRIIDKFQVKGKKKIHIKDSKPLAILLLGTVGAGKTTFLHYMRKVRIREIFSNKEDTLTPHWLHIDFLDNPSESSIVDFIYKSILEYINRHPILSSQEFVFDAFREDIEAIKSGPLFLLSEEQKNSRISDFLYEQYKNIKPYVDKIISHITKITSFFLVIDNVDQIELDDIQSRIFTESFSISRALSLNLVLSLRQSTFIKHKNSPAIDAFDFEVIQIDPPRISSVIAKRFALVKYMTSNKSGNFIAENGAKVALDDISQLVDIISGSVLGSEIGTRIEVLATDDVRLALRMTREFLERGYTSPGKAVQIFREQGRYLLPRHEAFRAILLGTELTYSESTSTIANPFDSNLAVTQMQLLRLYVLNVIVSYASDPAFRQIDGSVITEKLRMIGVGDSFTHRVLVDLCNKRFLFTVNHGEPTASSSFIPSRLGGYIAKELISNFTFIECMLYDTYIADAKTWGKLRDLSGKIESERDVIKRITMRVSRAKSFYYQMEKLISPLCSEAIIRGLPSQWCSNPLRERLPELRKELGRVLHSAKKTYQPKQDDTSKYFLDESV